MNYQRRKFFWETTNYFLKQAFNTNHVDIGCHRNPICIGKYSDEHIFR